MHRCLVAGTICGEILVYSAAGLETPAACQSVTQPKSGSVLRHMQSVQVCGGSVQCLAWSKDSRYDIITTVYVFLSSSVFDELGLMARVSSQVPQVAASLPRGVP